MDLVIWPLLGLPCFMGGLPVETALIRVTTDEGAVGGYRVELFSDDGSKQWLEQPLASFTLLADLAGEPTPAVLSGGPLGERVRRFIQENRQSGEFEAIGEHLAGLLFRGDLKLRWDELRGGSPEGLRTLLQIEPDDLRLLPWELMSRDGSLFVDRSCPFARLTRLVEDQKGELGPIRLLVVEGERDNDLGTQTEVWAIKSVLPSFGGRIEAEFLTEPSEPELKKRYERIRPHIFHFIGHGQRQQNNNDPTLRIKNAGRYWFLSRQYIRDLLRPTPRVAVLNACRSGDLDGVRALTDAFLSKNAAAVIGMQGNVQGQAAAQFGGKFYEALAKGELIDQAVTTARAEVYATVGVAKQERDWFLPSLTLRIRPEHVLPVTYGIPDVDLRSVESRLFKPVQAFVDRVDERDKLVKGIDPDNGRTPDRLLVLTGDLEVGKTWLLHWLRTRCAVRGRRVKYVDFRGDGSLDFLPALYAIRDTPEDVPSLAVKPDAFDRFNYDLTFLVTEGRLPIEPAGEVPKVQPPPANADFRPGPPDTVERIFESFRAALDQATSDAKPLLLIFDHVEGLLKKAFKDFLYPLLIKKIVELEPPNVRVVVVLSTEQHREYWPSDADRTGQRTEVSLIPPEKYGELVEDFLLAMGRDIGREKEQKFIAGLAGLFEEAWKPGKLQGIQMLVGIA
jgi:hypothetical protein